MPTPAPKMSLRARRVALITSAVISISLAIVGSVVVYQRQQPLVQRITYSQLYSVAEANTAVSLTVAGETLTVKNQDGSLVAATVTGEASPLYSTSNAVRK